MGCILKMYREWQLSGDDGFLKNLYPNVKKSSQLCTDQGGWDGDQDGVMEESSIILWMSSIMVHQSADDDLVPWSSESDGRDGNSYERQGDGR